MQVGSRIVWVGAVLCALAVVSPSRSQQIIEAVDFRPFIDGHNWIVRQPLTYIVGVSHDSVTVPPGFVTDFASIPPALQSIIQQNGPYLLPAVVHDYLYWKQTCTRKEADQILLLGMIEHKVPDMHRIAIYEAVRAAGGFAWDSNTRERAAHMIRIIPPDRLRFSADTLWPDYQKLLARQGVVDGPDTRISPGFCARGDMSIRKALRKP